MTDPRSITPLGRRTARGDSAYWVWRDEMQARPHQAEAMRRQSDMATIMAEIATAKFGPLGRALLHLFSEPYPFGAVDFDRLVAFNLTEALELLADARLAASDAASSAARAGRLAVEAVEALVGR